MLTRRSFLKGLLATIATTAINKNGVLRPSEELETPTRTIFDMAQNTWRTTYRDKGLSLNPVYYLSLDGLCARIAHFTVWPPKAITWWSRGAGQTEWQFNVCTLTEDGGHVKAHSEGDYVSNWSLCPTNPTLPTYPS